MTLSTRKIITLDQLIHESCLSSKEISSMYEDLSVDNYVPGQPFEIIVDITKDNQEDYSSHWKKMLNYLVDKQECQINEKVIVVESL